MKKLLAAILVLSILAPVPGATWSIAVVNTRTGEVAVGTATCVANDRLEKWVPVVVVGRGAGAAQAMVSPQAENRIRMWDGLHAGWTPEEIMEDLVTNGTIPKARQYGVSAFTGTAATYSGKHCQAGVTNIVGEVGELRYAIQGNVLTGNEVGLAAEAALIGTDGDLGERLMAAMEAARVMGGDGRCSCDNNEPTSCGAPPSDFDKSAHSGCVFVARIGDVDGDCTSQQGCATGDYYLRLAYRGRAIDPDPVVMMQAAYREWRVGLAGRPDHLLSRARIPAQSLPADGVSTTTMTIELVDVDGVPLATGGAMIDVAVEGDPVLRIGAVTDHEDGTYSFPIGAGVVPGAVRFAITADDGTARALLYPFPELRVDPVAPLHVGRDVVAVSEDSRVPLTLNVPDAAHRPYLILCSASGTEPGLDLGTLLLPLNPDIFLWRSSHRPNNAFFRHTSGVLDEAGRAEAWLEAPRGLLRDAIGRRMEWAAIWFDGGPHVTNVGGFDVVH